mmetsp:Transcript_23341/g.45498  ORF Transcript_23341/g.45498 Transcript_23341/m.45498 type:complete len:121 (+) Transcript_23341:140-502(+)
MNSLAVSPLGHESTSDQMNAAALCLPRHNDHPRASNRLDLKFLLETAASLLGPQMDGRAVSRATILKMPAFVRILNRLQYFSAFQIPFLSREAPPLNAPQVDSGTVARTSIFQMQAFASV